MSNQSAFSLTQKTVLRIRITMTTTIRSRQAGFDYCSCIFLIYTERKTASAFPCVSFKLMLKALCTCTSYNALRHRAPKKRADKPQLLQFTIPGSCLRAEIDRAHTERLLWRPVLGQETVVAEIGRCLMKVLLHSPEIQVISDRVCLGAIVLRLFLA